VSGKDEKIRNFKSHECIDEKIFYVQYTQNGKKETLVKNCFKIENTNAISGNSGCPVLDNNNIVYGMFFGTQELYPITHGKAIRSDYILSILNRPAN